ncbi:hypothetical protein KCP75_09415 [Salmonella enterica subsp. enterica]|nr:hypothetical protein KCP75_09415 [Salmonella enterica subsp. enterica]
MVFSGIWRGLPTRTGTVTNKSFKPTSMPTITEECGRVTRVQIRKGTRKQSTALRHLLEMATVDGTDGKVTTPAHAQGDFVLAMYSLPSRYLNALAGTRAACLCWLAFESRICSPSGEEAAKAVCCGAKDRWRGTCRETSLSRANSGSFFSAVRRALACR